MQNYRHLLLLFALFSASCMPGSEGDEQALRTLDEAYVEAWKEKGTPAQASAVLGLFTDAATIMPGGGADPRMGKEALKEFWFPEATPPTNVSRFDHVITGIDIENDLGVVYGRYELHFEFDGENYARVGNYQSVSRKQPDQNWRFTKMIWNDKAIEH